jgi:hypothetical protein
MENNGHSALRVSPVRPTASLSTSPSLSEQRLGYTVTPFAHIYNIFIIIMHKLAEAGD